MTSVAIVVLNYNGQHFLEEFLPSLTRHSVPYEVIVADNASTDNSLDFLKSNFSELRIIELSRNDGFAGGYNEALKHLEHDYFILINSDVEVTANWCQPLINYLETNSDFAACQPKIKSFTKKNEFEYAGAAGGYLDFLGYPFCKGRVFDILEEDHGQYNETSEIFWCSGACMAIKSDLFFEAGGFDRDFFAHMEEIDLCWRLQLMGYKIAYIPDSTIYHVGGGTLAKSNPKKTYLNFRNSLAVVTKNLPTTTLPIVLITRLLLDLVAAMVFIRTNSFAHFRAVMGAQRDFILSLPKTLKKRKRIKRLAKVSLFRRSTVLYYFLKGRKTFSEIIQ